MELLGSWRPYKARPAPDEPVGSRFEHGTMQHELLAGFVAAVEYVESIGWEAIVARERSSASASSPACRRRDALRPRRRWRAACRPFCFNLPGRTPEDVAVALAERDVAVWHGDYYAIEVMRRLGLDGAGARGDRPLQHRRGGRSPPRCRRGAGLEASSSSAARGSSGVRRSRRRSSAATRSRSSTGGDWPELFPDLEQLRGDRDGGLAPLEGRRWDAVVDPSGYVPRVVRASAELLAGNVEHYVFVSSISVYATLERGYDEPRRWPSSTTRRARR